METSLVTTVEGPKGKAEIYEVVQPVESGGQRFEYEVRYNGETQTCKALGEAYIVAGELAGTPT
jgi:hypothetical protein